MLSLRLRKDMMMAFYNPPKWFIKELQLANPDLTVKWNHRTKRWGIHNPDGSLSHLVQNKDGSFRPLDQRILRKIRIDTFFTHNDKALQRFLQEDNYGLRAWMDRGMEGVSDYLAGYNL
jgi:hypothetical protein